jgi:hypothetical protein
MKFLLRYSWTAARWTALLALLGGLTWMAWLRKEPSEPVYRGKRLSEWLANNNQGSSPETDEAVRRMGTNAIPTLLRMLQARDSSLTTWLLRLARKQHLMKFDHTGDFMKNAHAAHAFDILGADARDAVPELIKILDQNISVHSRNYTAWALGGIGPPAAKAVPTLLRATADTNYVRRGAIYALGKIRAQPELVVPALTNLLTGPDPNVRAITISSLELFGSDAKSAVPALAQSLNDPTPRVRKLAESALQKIDPEAAARANLKTNTLHRVDGGWGM